ncbi:hypothetical protein HanIR_Chr01g0039401 [Helianthus annuus]|nr:hypothetical protein HanIR_Chr01g0039401 [Helianthus annuus]
MRVKGSEDEDEECGCMYGQGSLNAMQRLNEIGGRNIRLFVNMIFYIFLWVKFCYFKKKYMILIL